MGNRLCSMRYSRRTHHCRTGRRRCRPRFSRRRHSATSRRRLNPAGRCRSWPAGRAGGRPNAGRDGARSPRAGHRTDSRRSRTGIRRTGYRARRPAVRRCGWRFRLPGGGGADTLKPFCKPRIDTIKLFQPFGVSISTIFIPVSSRAINWLSSCRIASFISPACSMIRSLPVSLSDKVKIPLRFSFSPVIFAA